METHIEKMPYKFYSENIFEGSYNIQNAKKSR